jgi:hypothetical protein
MASKAIQRVPLLIELTGEERQLLRDIRERKARLVNEIRQLTSEINNITGEIVVVDGKRNQFRVDRKTVKYEQSPDLTKTLTPATTSADHLNSAKPAHSQPDVITDLHNHHNQPSPTTLRHQNRLAAISQLLLQYQTNQIPTTIDLSRLVRQPPMLDWCDRSNKPIASVKPTQLQSASDSGIDPNEPNITKSSASPTATTNSSGDNVKASDDAIGAIKPTLVSLKQACDTFNQSQSKSAIDSLSVVIGSSNPIDLARLMRDETRLISREAVGRFLGQPNDLNQKVLQQFVRLHDFKRKAPEQALRDFLATFRLPGEAQQIQRFLELFAAHYCQCNPGHFQHEDQLFLLSYSLLMLNTLRHRPHVHAKLSRRRFKAMNLGVDRSVLRRAYTSVCRNPFQVPSDYPNRLDPSSTSLIDRPFPLTTNSDSNSAQGWLWKRSGTRFTARWRRRWFVLNERCLFYFARPTDVEPNGKSESHPNLSLAIVSRRSA